MGVESSGGGGEQLLRARASYKVVTWRCIAPEVCGGAFRREVSHILVDQVRGCEELRRSVVVARLLESIHIYLRYERRKGQAVGRD